MKTITAANSIFMLSVIPIYAVPQQLQGFAADAAFDTDAIEPAEVVMGVDGHMSAGYTPVAVPQTITLMPDSQSSDLFENWMAAQQLTREVYFAQGFISLPAVGRKYVMLNGVLTSIPLVAPAHKVLQARTFRITWESVTPSPF